jgi:hypothetical protein
MVQYLLNFNMANQTTPCSYGITSGGAHPGRHIIGQVENTRTRTQVAHDGAVRLCRPAEKHYWLICYERKILFWLKKQAEKDEL